MYKIEKGVPVTKVYGLRKAPAKYPWQNMDVGDSFFVDGAPIQRISHAASNASRRLGRKFACRTQDGGVRVWRVW